MFIGTRVVRGPDWPCKDQDGGEGHLGTIIDQSESGDKRVSVIWDMGRELSYKAGDGVFELRLFDNAQTGVNHPCKCSSCNDDPLWGIRWLCLECANVNLCTQCYMTDKHEITHTFGRLTEPMSSIVKLPTRQSSKEMVRSAKGLFPNAEVMRGPHWEWRDTDGGDGVVGVLKELCDWSVTSRRSAARVQWKKNKNVEIYRIGAEGRVDLLFTNAAHGFKYYKDHLSLVDIDSYENSSLKIGDKVRVELTKDQLKNVQMLSAGGWDDIMKHCVADIGTVIQIIIEGLVRVQYQNGDMLSINQILLSKIHSFQKGDLVRVIKDKKITIQLQQGHGGWSESYKKALGKLGRIVNVDDDGDISVLLDGHRYLFSPVCVDYVNHDDVKTTEKIPPVPDNLFKVKLFDPSDILGPRLEATKIDKKSLVALASERKLTEVANLLKENPSRVDEEENGFTALQIACHKGHEAVAKCLIEAKANIDKTDSDGNTPLHLCVQSHKSVVAKLLLDSGAKVDVKNKKGYTALHLAVKENRPMCVRYLVDANSDVHIKSPTGGTAVHDAMCNDGDHSIKEILKAENIKFDSENTDGFDMLQWATLKNCKKAVEIILSRDKNTVKRKKGKSGYTALHIAAANDYRDIARMLIQKGKADTNTVDALTQTPLHLAVKHGHLPMVELLLEHGANVNMQDVNGNSPLHVTQILPGKGPQTPEHHENNWANIACFLVEFGANLQLQNKNKKSPLDLAPAASRAYLERISRIAKERKQDKQGAGRIYLPLHWKEMSDKPLELVPLDKNDSIETAEFKNVEEKFLKGLPKRNIVEIVRVQNKFLWEHYLVKKTQLEKIYGKGNENEVNLFHGTKAEVVMRICTENFDFRIAGENVGTMYGKGIYFATEPSLSDTYCSEDENGLRHMIFAKVLAGRTTYGNPEMHKPPENYDSVVDYPAKPRIYCLFDFNQCYPEYVIKYK